MNLSEGRYRIYPIGAVLSQEKLCLTAKNNSKDPITDIVLERMEADNLAQQFTFEVHNGHYVIKAVHSELVLDVFGWGKSSGTKVIQYNCHYGDIQLWDISELSSVELNIYTGFIPNGKELLKGKHSYMIKSVWVKEFGLDINNTNLVNSNDPCPFIIEKV